MRPGSGGTRVQRATCSTVLSSPSLGTRWNYNGGHTMLLADILEQRSGRGLLDLVRTDLFEPLGITRWEWRGGSPRRPLADGGLRLASPDLLRLGQLLLAGGAWQGRQVVPSAWIAASLQPSITVGNGPFRYGHHWWDGLLPHNGRDLAWTAGVGFGGQRLFIVPELDLAVVFTAGAYGDNYGIVRKEFALFRLIVAAAECQLAATSGPLRRPLAGPRFRLHFTYS